MIRSERPCSRGLVGGPSPPDKGNSLSLSLLTQHPALQDSSPRQKVWKSLIGRESYSCICQLLDRWSLPAELMKYSGKDQGQRQAQGMRQAPGQGERIVRALQGLVRIPERPKGMSSMAE